MGGLKAAITIVMLLIFCVPAYSLEGAVPAQDKTAAAQEDNLLPIYKQGWQFFVAPSVWVPGANKERLLGEKKYTTICSISLRGMQPQHRLKFHLAPEGISQRAPSGIDRLAI